MHGVPWTSSSSCPPGGLPWPTAPSHSRHLCQGPRQRRGIGFAGARAGAGGSTTPGRRARAYEHRAGRVPPRAGRRFGAAGAQPGVAQGARDWRIWRRAPSGPRHRRRARTRTLRAEAHITAGIEYCSEHDLDGWQPVPDRNARRVGAPQWRWGDAADSAAAVLAGVDPERCTGRVRPGHGHRACGSRSPAGPPRGPGHWPPLDEALSLAGPREKLTRPARRGGEGRGSVARGPRRNPSPRRPARRLSWPGNARITGRSASWPTGAHSPASRRSYRGGRRAVRAADRRRLARCRGALGRLGSPYEAALALAEVPTTRLPAARSGGTPATGRSARGGDRGAAPAERGAKGFREDRVRGRGRTRPPDARQLEVLALVAQGLRNADIAEAVVPLQEDRRPPRLPILPSSTSVARPGERRGRAPRDRRRR